jgi:peroxiredoxin
MSLTEELSKVRENFFEKAPEDVKASAAKANKELFESGMATGLKEGEKAPDFTLTNAAGKEVSLYEELKKDRVVLTFYRGGWCPYCNLELKAYQNILNELREAGAELMAISPQRPDQSLSTQEKNELTFHVLSDPQQEVLRDYNVLFEFPDYLVDTYKEKFNLDLATFNDEEKAWKLPVPATFVIDRDGTILKASANADYTYRLDPNEVLAFLKQS